VQADYPIMLVVNGQTQNTFSPVSRTYQNTASARVAYNPQSDVASMHYVFIDPPRPTPPLCSCA
jgi:hypothetical protein